MSLAFDPGTPLARSLGAAKILLPALLVLLTGCGEVTMESTPRTPLPLQTTVVPEEYASPPETTKATTESPPESGASYGYTYGSATGNRVVDGAGSLDSATPVDVPLGGVPAWVVGAPFEDGVAWVVALEDGRVEGFRVYAGGEVAPVEVEGGSIFPGEPPLVRAGGGFLRVVASRSGSSDLTHPVPARPAHDLVGVGEDGGLFAEKSSASGVSVRDLQIDAPPDARVVRSGSGAFAVLSDPTEEYPHEVLGDRTEAKSLAVVDNLASGTVRSIRPQSGGVFEGISPLWFTDTGGRELLAVTESADSVGSRVAVYSPDGGLVAAGPFIGEALKWRHVLAAGPFGPEGELEIAAVRTPHVDPVVEFYRFSNGRLQLAAALPGYTSHRIYTRNLDTAVSGDLDGDGTTELLVPNATYTALAAIRHTESGAGVAWELPAGGEVATNIGSATDGEGEVSIAVGRSDGTLRVWR